MFILSINKLKRFNSPRLKKKKKKKKTGVSSSKSKDEEDVSGVTLVARAANILK